MTDITNREAANQLVARAETDGGMWIDDGTWISVDVLQKAIQEYVERRGDEVLRGSGATEPAGFLSISARIDRNPQT